MSKQRRTFSAEFKRDAAALVLDQGYSHLEKGYRARDVGRDRAYALIDQLSAHEPVDLVCAMFDVPRSCYYAHRRRRDHIDVDRMRLRGCVHEIFKQSRQAAGSRTVRDMLQESGFEIGRFKVRLLMRELGLISKQPGPPAYKQTKVEQPDNPNQLNRGFTVCAPNQVWCGDITYICAQGRWHYLAAVLDLYTRRVIGLALSAKPDAGLVTKALA